MQASERAPSFERRRATGVCLASRALAALALAMPLALSATGCELSSTARAQRSDSRATRTGARPRSSREGMHDGAAPIGSHDGNTSHRGMHDGEMHAGTAHRSTQADGTHAAATRGGDAHPPMHDRERHGGMHASHDDAMRGGEAHDGMHGSTGASTAVLPSSGGLFPETQLRLFEGDPRDVEQLADVERCAQCHADIVESWRASPHARASMDNPWYRQAVDSFREHAGGERGRFCAGCHDPVLLVAGEADQPVAPDDPRAHAGVTCMVCHGIREVRADGSASYTLSTRAVHLPDPGNPLSIREHVEALAPDPLRTSELCGACHRGFVGPAMGNAQHLDAVDELSAWRRSRYAGSTAARLDEPVERANCQGCHMPADDARRGDLAADDHGQVHSHRFPGAHTALAGATGDDAQLAAIQTLLRRAASIDVAAVRVGEARFLPADGADVHGGEHVELDVVVRNEGTGHRFPGGTVDTQDTWVEVEVRDADGARVAEAGTRHATEDDPEAHRLRALMVDANAEPEYRHHVERFRAKIVDHTIAPRDAEAARYVLDVPADARMPLSIEARLMHRRHNLTLARAACEAQRTARGRLFVATSRELGRAPIDACRPQPITPLANARVWIGEGSDRREASGGATAPTWRRLFDHALALIGDVQEHLDDARPSLAAAMETAPDSHARAMILAQQARLEGRQGRLEEALTAADQAEALSGPMPALDRLRADAYAQVWRWNEASTAYRRAAFAAPLDDTRWVDLSRALGSAGDDRGALAAVRRGLALQPRDESLLRTQYVVLAALGLPGADDAREAYVVHRSPDAIAQLRLECGRQHAFCREERLPVRTHHLRPAR